MTVTPSIPSPTASYSTEAWLSGYRSQPQEFSYPITEIEGTLPLDLEGTLYRNGPGLLDIHGYPIHHPFDGDGLISQVAFRQGQAFYRSRFVRTAGYVAEQQAKKPLYRGVFGTQKPGGPLANAFDLRLKNIANTHIIYWGGKLLALWEAAEPHRLDPTSLDTLGLDYLDGLLQPGDAFTAHPKFDPGHHGSQPRLVGFSVKAGLSSKITLFELDMAGQPVAQHSHTIPGFAFLHDFAITPNYAIFFQNPVNFNPLGYILGFKGAAACIDFNPKQPTRVLIIPRNGTDPVQTIETDPCFVFHHVNAYEDDGQLVVDSICYDRFPTLEGGDYTTVDFDHVPAGQLWRFNLNLGAQTARVERRVTRCVEFPTIHPEQVGRPYRYSFMGTAHGSQGNAPLQALLKWDNQTNQTEVWSAAPHGFMGEPVFVPRPQATAEDDGWVITLLYNAARRCSEVAILDGQQFASGPVATLKLQHHVPYGLHGSFVPAYFGPELTPSAKKD